MIATLAVMLGGCDKYDDTELRNKVNGYESRIAALESLSSYQTLLQKLQAGKTVTAYSQSGNDITLTFSDGSSVSFNQQGVPGESIKGDPGDPGKTPSFKIENETWKVSYDDGKTWSDVGSAIDRSLISNISADGNTLTITLADGTVIPVFYGEKESYNLTIGENGRKCYSFFETKTSELQRQLTIPYTLSGDLKNIDDVTIVPNITVLEGEKNDVLDAVMINPIDAKSGTIVLKQLDGTYDNEGEAFTRTYPPYRVDFMAYFPDGTTRVKTIEILGETSILSSDELTFIPLGSNQLQNDWVVPSEGLASSMYVEIRIGPHFSSYDGPEFPSWSYSDLFGVSYSSNDASLEFAAPVVTTDDFGYKNGGYRIYTFNIGLDIKQNTLTRDKDIRFSFHREGQSSEGGHLSYYWTTLRFVQTTI